jgi:quinoprotein glucose dehydrogenase
MSPSGGGRPGDNLFGSSVVALEAETGKLKWHFEATHHDLWDYDFPSPAALLDITVKGAKIPAVNRRAQACVHVYSESRDRQARLRG